MTVRRPALLVMTAAFAGFLALEWQKRSNQVQAPVSAGGAASRQRVHGEPAFDRERLLRALNWYGAALDAQEFSELDETARDTGDSAAAGGVLGAEVSFTAAGASFVTDETVVAPRPPPPTAGGSPSLEARPAGGSPSALEPTGGTSGQTQAPAESQTAESGLRSPALQVWTQTGLCAEQLEASEEIRQLLKTRFNVWEGGELGRFFLDPRLPDDARAPVLSLLERAEEQIESKLGLEPTRPDVFLYQDAELLRAAACVNDTVIAYYDGAMHVVASDRDLAGSVTHELAHHALISTGLRGPAWAQEGLAMHAADERWWLRRARLAEMTKEPFPLLHMEEGIPYKLPEERSITFYTQAAAMVACVLVRERTDLQRLAETVRDSIETLRDVRELFEPEKLEACIRDE